jgi:hypothetical protein
MREHVPNSLTLSTLCIVVPMTTAMTQSKPSHEIIFLVEEAPEGGFTARALGVAIFTEADDLGTLHANILDAVSCHFEASERPQVIRLHHVKEEVLTP